jgi:hypothetical protein
MGKPRRPSRGGVLGSEIGALSAPRKHPQRETRSHCQPSGRRIAVRRDAVCDAR